MSVLQELRARGGPVVRDQRPGLRIQALLAKQIEKLIHDKLVRGALQKIVQGLIQDLIRGFLSEITQGLVQEIIQLISSPASSSRRSRVFLESKALENKVNHLYLEICLRPGCPSTAAAT